MITHDLGVVADIADDVMVMYAGRAAEKADKHDIFYAAASPLHQGPAGVDPEQLRRRGTAHADHRPAAEPDPAATRLRLPPAVRLRDGPLPDRAAQAGRRGQAGAHRSACLLPAAAIGPGDEAEELRRQAVSEERHAVAAQVAEKIAAAPESEGSVIV